MSRSFLSALAALVLCFAFFSCQKELSFEVGQLSKGSLQSSTGECAPKTVGGTYKATQALGDSNYIDVTVDVTQTGAYTIFTDTVNGYWFRASGSFTNTGSQTVRLKGFGTPSAAGGNTFTVMYDSSFCLVPITVQASGGGTSVFTLQGAGGNCTGSNVAGTYTQGTALGSGHTVTLQVSVTTPGTWSVNTNTVAGVSFAGSGTFTATGAQTITLNGSGTPTAAGPQTFSVSVGTASCTFTVTVAPNTAPPAAFTLVGGPGACGSATPAGTYTQGTALTGANTVTVQVNVTTAGQWNASTNTVAGISFAGSGTFTGTGTQTIVLNGTGTPSANGNQTFTITAGSSTCTFTINIGGGTTPTGNHFPLTGNSWWSYNDPLSPGDTLLREHVGTGTYNGNTYQVIEESDVTGPIAEYYYRKAGNDYFELTEVDYYSVMSFDNSVIGEILFLKEGLTNGATWLSAEYTGTENNVNKKLRFSFECLDANANGVVINGKTFNGVYKIRWKSQVSTNGGAFTDEGLVWESWYAQGVGLIHMKGTFGANSFEMRIRNWQVF